jgi:hypothetical protein
LETIENSTLPTSHRNNGAERRAANADLKGIADIARNAFRYQHFCRKLKLWTVPRT